MNNPHASRYPGIRSFERSEQSLFFGRQKETHDLFEAVKVKPLTVLFSKSGIGKTSLINAGLAPVLEQNGYLPVFIRLQDTSVSPVETVQKVLSPFLDTQLLEKYSQTPTSLWEYVRACQFGNEQLPGNDQPTPLTPVLIFDQFEELFTHEKSTRDDLTRALADLLNERLPEGIRQGLRAYPRPMRTNEVLAWYEPLKIKVVFAIRADRLGDLDELKFHIPTVLHDRFHLKPLSRDNAREAIIQPALLTALPQDRTYCPVFQYDEAAVSEILKALGNEQGEIESFQLQLLCSFLEAGVLREGQIIHTQDYGGQAGIKEILNDYYERTIGTLNAEEQLAARRFIEEGLIVNGRRVGLPEGAELTQYAIGPELKDKLLNSRILRTEVIHLGKIYELSHDTLIEPILRSFEKRKTEEELRRQERVLTEIQQKRNRAKKLAFTGFFLFSLALAGGVLAWINAGKAQKARLSAETSALAAKAWNIYRDDPTLAFRMAQFAFQNDTNNQEALQTIQKIINEPATAFYQTVFTRHSFEVISLAFSPDGKHVASGGFDSEIFIWDHQGNVIQHFSHAVEGVENSRQSGPVCALYFSKDGQKLYSADTYGRFKTWSLESGRLIRQFTTQRSVKDMAVSLNEQYILTAGNDSTAVMWDMEGRMVRRFAGHLSSVNAVVFSPDNQHIATGGDDHTARIWNTSGGLVKVIEVPSASVINDVQFSPDANLLVLACSDHTARLYDNKGTALQVINGHSASVSRVQFSPDGKYLLTASYDRSAKLWTLAGEEVLRLSGHSERLNSAAISPDGKFATTGGYDFQARLWNIEFNTHNHFSRHTNYVNKIAMARDGSFILSASSDFTIKKWSFNGVLLADMKGHKTSATGIAVSPDGKIIASTSNDKNIRLWTSDGRIQQTISTSKSDVLKAVFTNDGRYLVSSNFLGIIEIFDLKTNKAVRSWSASQGKPIQSIALSPDNKYIYSGGSDGWLKAWSWSGDSLWSTNTGANIWSLDASPDGEKILTAGTALPVSVWTSDGRLIKNCFGHLSENYHVTWSQNGAYFASSSWDKTAKIWDKNGTCIQTLPHPDGVYGSSFSPDGQHLITACRDKLIRVWNVKTGDLVRIIGTITDVKPFFDAAEIAPLAAIPFDWERFDIPAATAEKMYQSNPANLLRQGIQNLGKATEIMGDLEGCIRFSDEAERIFIVAGKADPNSKIITDSLIAEVYSLRCNLFILHGKFEKVVQTARKGAQFKPLESLILYEISGLLLSGHFDEALNEAKAIRAVEVKQVEYYIGMTLGEAAQEELLFFRDQYGIDHPDVEKFLQAMK